MSVACSPVEFLKKFDDHVENVDVKDCYTNLIESYNCLKKQLEDKSFFSTTFSNNRRALFDVLRLYNSVLEFILNHAFLSNVLLHIHQVILGCVLEYEFDKVRYFIGDSCSRLLADDKQNLVVSNAYLLSLVAKDLTYLVHAKVGDLPTFSDSVQPEEGQCVKNEGKSDVSAGVAWYDKSTGAPVYKRLSFWLALFL